MPNPNCSRCDYFYITIDERRPHACKVFNIKCPGTPSVEVKKATGFECPVFKPKIKHGKKDTKIIKEESIFDTFA